MFVASSFFVCSVAPLLDALVAIELLMCVLFLEASLKAACAFSVATTARIRLKIGDGSCTEVSLKAACVFSVATTTRMSLKIGDGSL